MASEGEAPAARERPPDVAPDRVTRLGDRLVVDAARGMPDWEPRRYRRPAVLMAGRRWFVSRREAGAGERVRYTLEPWPEEGPADPVFEISYDAEYVAVREANRRAELQGRAFEPLAAVLTPFVGFLPSRAKRVLEERHGLSARIATEQSITVEYGLFALASVLLAIVSWTGIIPGLPFVNGGTLLPALVLLGADGAVRWSKLKEEREPPYGFLEWLWRVKRG